MNLFNANGNKKLKIVEIQILSLPQYEASSGGIWRTDYDIRSVYPDYQKITVDNIFIGKYSHVGAGEHINDYHLNEGPIVSYNAQNGRVRICKGVNNGTGGYCCAFYKSIYIVR